MPVFRGSKQSQRGFAKALPLPYKGINYVRPPHAVGAQEMCDCLNWWLSPLGKFETRPGVVKFLAEPLPAPIRAISWHSPTDTILMVAGTHLYSVPMSGGTATDVGELTAVSESDEVTMAPFQGKTYIATGGLLQAFDGTTVGAITVAEHSRPAPDAAGCLAVRNNRLWVGERDGSTVWFSGSTDATDWGKDPVSGEGGETLNGGSFTVDKNDGGTISGLANFHSILAVFKSGNRNSIHKISGQTSTQFVREQMAEGISCVNPQTVAAADHDVMFAGNGGIFSLRVTDNLGNIQAIPASLRVNNLYESEGVYNASFDPRWGMLLVPTRGGSLLLRHRGLEGWFRFVFSGFTARVVEAFGDREYVGGSDGMLYVFDDAAQTDGGHYEDGALVDDGREYQKAFLTKAFTLGGASGRAYVEKLLVAMKVHRPGQIYVGIMADYGAEYAGTIHFARDEPSACGWDVEASWDTEGEGWDQSGMAKIQAKISKESDNMQFQFVTTCACELYEMSIVGGAKGPRRWEW